MRVLDWVYRTQASQPPILVPAGIIIVSIVVTAFFAVLPLKLFMSSNFSMLSTLSIFLYTAPNMGTASQREEGWWCLVQCLQRVVEHRQLGSVLFDSHTRVVAVLVQLVLFDSQNIISFVAADPPCC